MTDHGIDTKLLERIASGRTDAFRILFDTFAPQVYRYALLRAGTHHVAEEIVQEAMVAVWHGREALPRCQSPAAWIYGIAKRKIADHWRIQGRSQSVPLTDAMVQSLSAPAIESEQGLDLLNSLAQLDDEAKELVFLVFYCGLSYQEVGQVLGIPEGTVKSRVYYLRRRLKEALSTCEARREAVGR